MNKTCAYTRCIFVETNHLYCTRIIKSVREMCVLLRCVFLKITIARIVHKSGAPVSASPDCVK